MSPIHLEPSGGSTRPQQLSSLGNVCVTEIVSCSVFVYSQKLQVFIAAIDRDLTH